MCAKRPMSAWIGAIGAEFTEAGGWKSSGAQKLILDKRGHTWYAWDMTGRADAIRRSYRLAPDVIQLIEARARADSTTATAIIEAAVRAYVEGDQTLEARVAALETWRREQEQERGG